MTSVEADTMIAESKKNNVQLMVGHLLQYHPAFIALRRLMWIRERLDP